MKPVQKVFVALAVGLPLSMIGAGLAYQRVATTRDLTGTPPPGRLVNIGTHRLHIWCTGSGEPTVVLESGLGANAFGWVAVRREATRVTQVCSYDRSGLGYSDESPSPRSAEHIADELALLLDSAHVQQPVLIAAASLGGLNARLLAAKYPAKVAGLILVDASHEDQNDRLVAAGFQPDDPADLKYIPIFSALGLLRLRGETLGRNPEQADTSVRRHVRATIHRTSRYRALFREEAHGDRQRAGRAPRRVFTNAVDGLDSRPRHARHRLRRPARTADDRDSRRH